MNYIWQLLSTEPSGTLLLLNMVGIIYHSAGKLTKVPISHSQIIIFTKPQMKCKCSTFHDVPNLTEIHLHVFGVHFLLNSLISSTHFVEKTRALQLHFQSSSLGFHDPSQDLQSKNREHQHFQHFDERKFSIICANVNILKRKNNVSLPTISSLLLIIFHLFFGLHKLLF